MSAASNMKQILTDLDIDFSMIQEDPGTLIRAIVAKSKEISAELDKNTTVNQAEQEFKEKAYRNEEARDRAREIKSQIISLFIDEDPDVIVNVVSMLAEVVQQGSNQVRTMAMRESSELALTKKHWHMMYTSLKKGYDIFITWAKMFHPEAAKEFPGNNFPMIPSKSGNYGDKGSSGVVIYRIWIDDEVWVNPYSVAKKLGLEIKHYMDIVDIIKESNYEIQGHKIRLEEA